MLSDNSQGDFEIVLKHDKSPYKTHSDRAVKQFEDLKPEPCPRLKEATLFFQICIGLFQITRPLEEGILGVEDPQHPLSQSRD